MEIVDKQISMHKGMFLSCAIHTVCIAGIVLFGAIIPQRPATVRILLTLDPPGGGGGGGGGSHITAETHMSQVPLPSRRYKDPHTHKADRVVHPTPGAYPVTDKVRIKREVQASVPRHRLPENTPAPAVTGAAEASDGGKGIGSGGGRGSGVGTGIGSGVGSGTGSGIGTGIGSGIGSGIGNSVGPGQGRAESLEVQKNRYLRKHFAYIRDLILKNLAYPSMAKKFGWQGKMRVSFVIKEDGKVEKVKIVESSGYEVLDKNVTETIREIQPFPKPPVRAELIIPVTYALRKTH